MSVPSALVDAQAVKALRALEVLDSEAEAAFDALVRIASEVCGTPISLVSLLDADRQWFKANIGLAGVTETPRDVAFCAHAVQTLEVMVVSDAATDQRFALNPLVLGEPKIRFYAGAPLVLSDGSRVGTLCVIDRVPRDLDEQQLGILADLALVASKALETRKAVRQQSESLRLGERARQLLQKSGDAVISVAADGTIQSWNPAAERMFGYSELASRGMHSSLLVPGHLRADEMLAFERLAEGESQQYESVRVRSDGSLLHASITLVPELDEAGKLLAAIKFVRDMTRQRAMEQAVAASEAELRLVVDTSPSMLAYWNRDLTNRFANRAYEQWFGVDSRALRGRHIRELLGPELFERNRPYIEAALAGKAQAFEREIATPSGLKHSLARYQPDIRDGQVVGFLVEVSDVTPLKEAEAALRREAKIREEAYADLQNIAAQLAEAQRLGKVGNWYLDVRTNETTYSAEMFRIFGLDPLAGAPSLADRAKVYTPESYAVVLQWVTDALATGAELLADLEFVRPDGSHGWLEAHGEPIYEDGKVIALRGTANDITERKTLLGRMAEQNELLRVTLLSIGDAVITTDSSECITWMNPVAERLTGWLANEAVGRPLLQVFHIVHEDTRAAAMSPIAASLSEGRTVGLPERTLLISRNGVEFGIEDSASPIRSERGEVLGAVLVFHDVTEQRRMSNEMTFRATHDALTGLVNRGEFEGRLQRAMTVAQLEDSQSCLLYIDLDQFKLVNDACGHASGDQLLQQVGMLLEGSVRTRDTVARLGGDEFGILLEHCPVEQASRVAQQICDRMDEYRFVHDGKRFRLGTSVGLVPIDRRWTTLAALLQAADSCCYAAKEAGRNRVHAWYESDASRNERSGEVQWATRLEQAIDEDRFVLYAQRIYPIDGAQKGLHAEILVRLAEPNGTIVAPGLFLPAAERFNMAPRIDRLVLRKSILVLKSVNDLGSIDALNINLSGKSIGDRAFHRQAVEILSEAGHSICARICLEITETAAITNLNDASSFISEVRQLGCRVALDDFGAGSSSFGYLKSLAVDYLKIDGQFVKDINDDPLDEAAVQCFVQVAKVIGVQTVAEFVDQESVLKRLIEMGVNWGQGYFLHRPEPIEIVLSSLLPSRHGESAQS